jgi:hypothetical protein
MRVRARKVMERIHVLHKMSVLANCKSVDGGESDKISQCDSYALAQGVEKGMYVCKVVLANCKRVDGGESNSNVKRRTHVCVCVRYRKGGWCVLACATLRWLVEVFLMNQRVMRCVCTT